MYEEISELPPNLYWGKLKSHKHHAAGGRGEGNGFRCRHCSAYVYTMPVLSGVQNRNHCPYCLWSRHVDLLQAGDRLSACKATMQPIGLTVKKTRNKYGVERGGELMVIHRCSECGKTSINRIAGDDLVEVLMGIFQSSLEMDGLTRTQLEQGGIRLLQVGDAELVTGQLLGR